MKRPEAGAYDPLMTVEFGLALENFTPEAKVPDLDALSAYSIAAEELGFASVWAWDHLFLGARRPFPFLEALTTLSMVAARTSRIMLGTGILVLPIRTSSPRPASAGWRMACSPCACPPRSSSTRP
jgi:alkanesulfonate monooxygenase SsuD/methylene tetrahydromethanopterin reductase-like flavin-dependent oxidoreductase (luciferase family)